jgi:hypothetical protein
MSFLLTPGTPLNVQEPQPQAQKPSPAPKSEPKPNFMETAEAILNSYKKIKFMMPEADRPAIEAITEDMRILIENYSGILHDSSAFSQKLMRDLDSVKAELKEAKDRNAAYEKELWDFRQTTSANINKRQFSFYVMSAKSRAPTEAEWLLFNETFTIDYKHINAKVYDWIDTNLRD